MVSDLSLHIQSLLLGNRFQGSHPDSKSQYHPRSESVSHPCRRSDISCAQGSKALANISACVRLALHPQQSDGSLWTEEQLMCVQNAACANLLLDPLRRLLTEVDRFEQPESRTAKAHCHHFLVCSLHCPKGSGKLACSYSGHHFRSHICIAILHASGLVHLMVSTRRARVALKFSGFVIVQRCLHMGYFRCQRYPSYR